MTEALSAAHRSRTGIPWAALLPTAGFAAMAAPTAFNLYRQEWTQESGAHGPVVLAIGAWLIWRRLSGLGAGSGPGGWIGVAVLLALSLPLYVFGGSYDFLTLQCAGLFGAGVALLYGRCGLETLKALAFPLVFLALAIPAPHAVIDALTGPLKQLVSSAAASGLAALGLPVAREGATIFVAQYQLLVEDACSGLNSLQGLITMGLLYAYLAHGPSLVHSVLLTALAVPIAIFANVVRVALLVVTTYAFGQETSEGVLHVTAGLVLFGTALLLILAADRGLRLVLTRGRR